MKGARYRCTILLSGDPVQLDETLGLLTEAEADAAPKLLRSRFNPYLVLVPPVDDDEGPRRLGNLRRFGCERFKKVSRLKVTRSEEHAQIDLRIKTFGGFPDVWLEAVSLQMPDWEFLAIYQSRDDHVDMMFRLQDGYWDSLYEDREWWTSPSYSGGSRLDDYKLTS